MADIVVKNDKKATKQHRANPNKGASDVCNNFQQANQNGATVDDSSGRTNTTGATREDKDRPTDKGHSPVSKDRGRSKERRPPSRKRRGTPLPSTDQSASPSASRSPSPARKPSPVSAYSSRSRSHTRSSSRSSSSTVSRSPSPPPKKKAKKKAKKSKKKRKHQSSDKEDGRFKVVQGKSTSKYELGKSLAGYINQTSIRYQSEADLKENILKDQPVPENILKVPELDGWMESILKSHSHNETVGIDNQLKRIDKKVRNILGPLIPLVNQVEQACTDPDSAEFDAKQFKTDLEKVLCLVGQARVVVNYQRQRSVLGALNAADSKAKDVIAKHGSQLRSGVRHGFLFGERMKEVAKENAGKDEDLISFFVPQATRQPFRPAPSGSRTATWGKNQAAAMGRGTANTTPRKFTPANRGRGRGGSSATSRGARGGRGKPFPSFKLSNPIAKPTSVLDKGSSSGAKLANPPNNTTGRGGRSGII